MSRTRKTSGGKSPIKKYVTFSGGTGMLSYYDKEASAKVELESLDMTVLDVKSSITGFSESSQTGISSNLVSNLGKEELRVVTFNGKTPTVIAEGIYKDIKDEAKSAGGKFTANVLCLVDFGDGDELTNVQLSGSALNGWIDFLSDNDNNVEYDNVITITGGALSKRGKNGNVPVTAKEEKALDAKIAKNARTPRPIWFYVLDVVASSELTEVQAENATIEDEALQAYFDTSSTTSKVEATDTDDVDEPEDNVSGVEDDDDLPF